MSVLAVVLTLALLAAVIAVVSRPLLAPRNSAGASREAHPDGRALKGTSEQADREADARRADHADLEAAREAKYREIRDAELDYRTGKLSREDYEAIDGTLRAEAVAILDRLESPEREDRATDPPK